jgi:hypothetical protein
MEKIIRYVKQDKKDDHDNQKTGKQFCSATPYRIYYKFRGINQAAPKSDNERWVGL